MFDFLRKKSNAFTLLEIIISVVIIGILLSLAVPKFFIGRDDARLVLARSEVSAIISGISIYHSKSILVGSFDFPDLSPDSNGRLFAQVLDGGIMQSQNSGWSFLGKGLFKFTINDKSTIFKYDNTNGSFECASSSGLREGLCAELMR